ncbi:MAG: alkaline phosphatase family protein [Bacteroidales bacterium]|nr:alkaline phosphatase family protein [Bacteroidales bacterium]
MRKALLSSILFLACCLAMSSRERKAVIIIVDGIPRDVVERLHVPVIFDIASHGAFGASHVGGEVGMYNQTPTISAVGYNSMLTGVWVNKHNVYGNSNLSPNYNYWSLFRIAKEQGKPLRTGIFSSWTDNRTVLLGEGKPETGDLKIDYVRDGYDLDKVNYPDKEKDLNVFDYDERVSREAEKCIREDAPDLSWVYLWYTDDASHMYGNGSYFDEYILKAGEQIDRVWQAVQYRQKRFGEDWMVIVTTDHGRTVNGRGHGGQSPRERATWIATNQKVNRRFKDGDASMVDINPTVCEFLGMEVPDQVAWERDGIPFIGKTEISDLEVSTYDREVILTWRAWKKSAPVSVYACPANDFKTTGRENWIHLGDLKAGDREFRYDLDKIGQSDQYKFVVVGGHESLSRWLMM